MRFEINIVLFIFIILLALLLGFGLALWYMLHKIKKMLGIKSLKELEKQMKRAKEMKKRMKKGNLNDMLNDPQIRKQMEEFRKRFGGGV